MRAVETSLGTVVTSTVVCAAGAWSPGSRRPMAGVELPVTPLRRAGRFTEPVPGLPEPLPMTIDFATGFYFHREGAGLLGMADPDEPPGFSCDYDDAWLPELAEVAERRAPRSSSIGVAGGWAGLYEVTPDHNALIGEAAAPRASCTRPASPATASCRRRPSARSCATSCSGASRSSTSPPLSADRFAAGASGPSATSSESYSTRSIVLLCRSPL